MLLLPTTCIYSGFWSARWGWVQGGFSGGKAWTQVQICCV